MHNLRPQLFAHGNDVGIDSVEQAKDILAQIFVEQFKVPANLINTAITSLFSHNFTSKNELLTKMYNFVTNNVFVCPTLLFAELLSKLRSDYVTFDGRNPDVTAYGFNYDQRSNYNQLPELYGVIHNEEIPVMFGESLVNT